MAETIQIGFINLAPVPGDALSSLLSLLPLQEKARLLEYRQPADRLRGATGKLMLRALLQERGYGPGILYHLQNDEYHRPYIGKEIDFNISHAGQVVAVALSASGRIGIDVEEQRPIQLQDFENFFTPAEMNFIQEDEPGLRRFYSLWTKKEAVMKANGKGMHLPVRKILIEESKAWCEGQEWWLQPVDVQENYTCHVAMTKQAPVELKEFSCVFEEGNYQLKLVSNPPDNPI